MHKRKNVKEVGPGMAVEEGEGKARSSRSSSSSSEVVWVYGRCGLSVKLLTGNTNHLQVPCKWHVI